MRLRSLALMSLCGALIGAGRPAAADDAKALMKKAIESAQNGDFKEGIGHAEKAVAAEPKNREAILLLGALTWENAAESKDKAERIKGFHKAGEVVRRLSADKKELSEVERMYLERTKYGEARALALEGKAKESVALVRELIAGGLDELDMLEKEDDLAPIRGLPEYPGLKGALLAQIKANVAKALQDTETFPFDFELKDLDNKPVKLADFKGKVTIVDVWGTWCPPCRQEIPHFVDLYKAQHPKGLEIVGINCNEDDDPNVARKLVKKFVGDEKIPYTCVINDGKTEGKIPGFQGYPTTMFLDRTGKVRMTLVGYTAKPKLEAIVETLLAEPAKN